MCVWISVWICVDFRLAFRFRGILCGFECGFPCGFPCGFLCGYLCGFRCGFVCGFVCGFCVDFRSPTVLRLNLGLRNDVWIFFFSGPETEHPHMIPGGPKPEIHTTNPPLTGSIIWMRPAAPKGTERDAGIFNSKWTCGRNVVSKSKILPEVHF